MGGKPKAPKPPPPPPAPVRADSAAGEQAYSSAARRDGLRKTINPADPLAPKNALGSMGALGMGGEGEMINNAPPEPPKRKGGGGNNKGSKAILGGGVFGF
jgi:hypothetical protein